MEILKSNICKNGFIDHWERTYPGKPIPRDIPIYQIDLCRIFINEYLKPMKVKSRSSYHYKHAVERVNDTYICNGAFIMACIIDGHRIERIGMGPNVRLFMDYRDKQSFKACNPK